MQVLLNSTKYFKKLALASFLLLALLVACKSDIKKTPVKKTEKTSQPKPIVKKVKEPEVQQNVRIKKKDLLVKDIINQKNVKQFFLDYGKKNPETKLLLKTRLGNMYITLYKQTPLHRASFIYLIKNGYLNHTCFHRIVKDFIIQGGNGDNPIVDRYRIQMNRYRLPPEFRKGVHHKKGALSATRRWVDNPDKLSNPFEFFIMQTSIDCSHLNGEHTVFGQVTKGYDVIDKICDLELDGNSEWPLIGVDIEFEILK